MKLSNDIRYDKEFFVASVNDGTNRRYIPLYRGLILDVRCHVSPPSGDLRGYFVLMKYSLITVVRMCLRSRNDLTALRIRPMFLASCQMLSAP